MRSARRLAKSRMMTCLPPAPSSKKGGARRKALRTKKRSTPVWPARTKARGSGAELGRKNWTKPSTWKANTSSTATPRTDSSSGTNVLDRRSPIAAAGSVAGAGRSASNSVGTATAGLGVTDREGTRLPAAPSTDGARTFGHRALARPEPERLERHRPVEYPVPVTADARLDLRGEPFAARPVDLAWKPPREDDGRVHERPEPVRERRAPAAAQHLGRRAGLLEAVPGERLPVGEEAELQLLLAIEDDREELERDVVERREREVELAGQRGVGADEADRVAGAEVGPHRVPRHRERVRQLLAAQPVPAAR